MTMNGREEIDFREKLADEIAKEGENLKLEGDIQWALNRAIAVVRKPIVHGHGCPCSICQRFDIVSCSDNCSDIRKLLPDELSRLDSSMAHSAGALFFCGYCRNGQNEWHLDEMLYDIINEIAVTPCCHTEATEALSCYCPEGQCEAEDDSTAQQDRREYISAQTGR